MTLQDTIQPDIDRFEAETGIKFRTAHRQSKGRLHHVVMPADLHLPPSILDDNPQQ